MDSSKDAAHRSREDQDRLEALLKDILEHRLPFNEIIGLRVASFVPESPRLAFSMRPELVGSYIA